MYKCKDEFFYEPQERIFDYCEPHTCDFNHELGEQNSQRI